MGWHLLWDPDRPRGDVLCTVFARGTWAIFYKPVVPSMWYLTSVLFDPEGYMLNHNGVTDTLMLMVGLMLSVWMVVATVASLPVLVCFFYIPLAAFVPFFVAFRSARRAFRIQFKGFKPDVFRQGQQGPRNRSQHRRRGSAERSLGGIQSETQRFGKP